MVHRVKRRGASHPPDPRITGGLTVSAQFADIVLTRHEAAVSGGLRLFDHITDFMGFCMVSRAGFEPATH